MFSLHLTIIDHDSVLLQEKVDVCVELCLAAFPHEDQHTASTLHILLDGVKLGDAHNS